MSKASEWAVGRPFLTGVEGLEEVTVTNKGDLVFRGAKSELIVRAKDAPKLGRWILDIFGEAAP